MIEAQIWLDKNYPKEEREEINHLFLPNKKLVGRLDLSDFVNLKFLFCRQNRLTSLNVNHNPKLTHLFCDDWINKKINGLKKTSLCVFDCKMNLDRKFEESQEPQYIWKGFVRKYKNYCPELVLIDISDLDQLVAQVNKQTANDDNFLTQFCPLEPEEFIKDKKGNFYWICDQLANRILARCLILQNRLYEGKAEQWEKEIYNLSLEFLKCGLVNPKIPAAARISTRQDLVDKVLNGDQELISRIKDLYDQQTNFYWIKEEIREKAQDEEKEIKIIRDDGSLSYQELQDKLINTQLTIFNHLKRCTTILFNSNLDRLNFANLKEETEKIERGCHEIKNQNQELKDKLELMEELLKKLELENLQVEKLENKIQAWPKNENS